MLNIIEYKGIHGYVEYVPEAIEFQIKTISVADTIYVTGKSAEELEAKFAKACEEHISKCEKLNIPATIMPSGKIESIDINPDLHEKAMMTCFLKGISMDELIERALNKYFCITY